MKNQMVKLMAGKAVDGFKSFAKETIKESISETGSKIAKEKVDEFSTNLSDSSKKTSAEKKELNDKYIKLEKLLISTSSTFKEYMEGIEEAQGVINLYSLKINTISKKNPAYLLNKNSLVTQQNKWKALKTSLSVDLTNKLKNECLKIFRTKEDSPFFKSHNQINADIIACKNEVEVNKIKGDLFKRYNLTYTISTKGY